jgi:hypothetical protein
MTATVPEQVVVVDLNSPPTASDILDQLVPSEVCALVADPNFDRRLRYTLTLCLSNNGGRCDEGSPKHVLKKGLVDDPDIALPEPRLCATVEPDGNLFGILFAALNGDVLKGLGGIDSWVELRVGGEDADPVLDQYAGKVLRVSPKIPMQRTANKNPTVDHFDVQIGDAAPVQLPLGRCVDQTAPLEMVAGQTFRVTPVEPPDARETYVVPTLDGKIDTFTEAITYQWLAGSGGFSSGSTGGPRDIVSGSPAPLFTDFNAPEPVDVPEAKLVPFWVVQREERLGGSYFESCIRVLPQ